MKTICIVLALAFSNLSASAQLETITVSYLKVDREAVANDIPFSEKTIMKAIENKMGQMGYKGKESKGFTVYKSVKLDSLGSGEYDLYFIAERKGRQNKDNSRLTLMISKGFDNFITAKTDEGLVYNAKRYLKNMVEMIAAYDLEIQIIDQQDAASKADKKYNNLIDNSQSLEKKRQAIEKDIEDNKIAQASQLDDIKKQKLILETLKASRKQ